MREEGPSRTAIGVALHRAAHQVFDRPPVFVDPFAARIIGARARAALDKGPRRYSGTPFASNLRAALAVRSRIAEEALAAAGARGVRQYVVLGAGLDTFALRNQDASLRVFEVDHQNTQRWKRARLREEGLQEPANLVFVPMDFERQDLLTELGAAGFDSSRPAFFSWLGVVPYLEQRDIWTTLGAVAAAAGPEGGVVFDFVGSPARESLWVRLSLWIIKRRVARIGEPLRSLLDQSEVRTGLEGLRFTQVELLGKTELNRRYFQSRADGLRVSRLLNVVVATRSNETGKRGV